MLFLHYWNHIERKNIHDFAEIKFVAMSWSNVLVSSFKLIKLNKSFILYTPNNEGTTWKIRPQVYL